MVSSLKWKESDYEALAWLISLSGALVSILGIVEVFHIYPLYGIPDRILSLFGYPNLVAQFLLIALVFEIGLVFISRSFWLQGINGFCLILNGLCLFLTYCRSAWFALMIAGTFVIVSFHRRGLIVKRKAIVLAGFVFITLASCGIMVMHNYGAVQNAQSIATLQEHAWKKTKVSQIFQRGDSSRFYLWAASLKMFLSHPAFGVGAGNYYVAYPQYSIDPDKSVFVKWAHNDYLNLLAELGVLGISLLGIWFWLITKRAIRVYRSRESKREQMLLIVLLAITIGIAVDAFFSYDWYMTVPSMFLWTVWGIFQSYDRTEKYENFDLDSQINSPHLIRSSLLILALILFSFSIQNIHRKFSAHQWFSRSRISLARGETDLAVGQMEKAIQLERYDVRYHYLLGLYYMKQGEGERALRQLETVKAFTPYGLAANLLLSLSQQALGRFDAAVEGLRNLKLRYPDDQILARQYWSAMNDQANLLTEEGRYEDAIRNYELILKENPELGSVHYNLGNTYLKLGKYEKALSHFKKSLSLNPEQSQKNLVGEKIRFLEKQLASPPQKS
ncbi:MAG: tetratricopeptide repeat protein [Candidatus Omnitrophica bacterium]|nr:tetratricopeptide repeat protein [Candidatus Omnitrophota bacterium]